MIAFILAHIESLPNSTADPFARSPASMYNRRMTDYASSPRWGAQSLDDFLAAVAADSPAPGGGSVAALAGALGAALSAMVAHLTLGRERYVAHDAEMRAALPQAEALRQTLTGLMDADTAAYSAVMAAYKLPRETDAQRTERTAALQAALRSATDAPLATAAACVDVLALAGQAAARGNRNAAGDAAAAALLAHAGLQIAVRNVESNLRSIRDADFVAEARQRAAALLAAGEQALAAALRAADAGV